jgi:NADH-quinone oxidoreductase subunit I
MKRREELTFLEKIYVVEIAKGVWLTAKIFFRNLFLHIAHFFGFKLKTPASVSIQYPTQYRPYPPRYRGRHRLTLYPNGNIRCTACFLCATACPAKCIHIEAAQHPDPNVEKFPKRYEIDTLLCIYCGYCVEACPVDAIRMDTGIHPEVYPPDPRLFIEDKETLMERSRKLDDLAIQGKTSEQLFKDHIKKMQALERFGADQEFKAT